MNGFQNLSQKIINRGYLMRFVSNAHVYQAPESSCFISASAIGTQSTVQFINNVGFFFEITHVKLQ